MGKQWTLKGWIQECEQVIRRGDMEELKVLLDQLNEEKITRGYHRYWANQQLEKLFGEAEKKDRYKMIKTVLDHPGYSALNSAAMRLAILQDDKEVMKLALQYCDPNMTLTCDPAGWIEGVNYMITAEPLGLCAFYGRVELAKLLLEHGARPEGMIPADMMKKSSRSNGIVTYPRIRMIYSMDKEAESGERREESLMRLPPWAYAMFCRDPQAVEFFFGLGEDRYTLELAMGISMVQDGKVIELLRKHKPNVMATVRPEFVLRNFWPEVIKAYFDDGRPLPENALECMGKDLVEGDRHREKEFAESLAVLLQKGYAWKENDLSELVMYGMFFRSQRLLALVKNLKKTWEEPVDVTEWMDLMPVEDDSWAFGEQLIKAGIRFQCKVNTEFCPQKARRYTELNRLFKLVEFQVCQPEQLDRFSSSVLLGRSKKAMALLWKKGLINPKNLALATKLICDLQITELYELSAELAGFAGGSEVRYEL